MTSHRFLLAVILVTSSSACASRALDLAGATSDPARSNAPSSDADGGEPTFPPGRDADCLAKPLACDAGLVCAPDVGFTFHCLPAGVLGYGKLCDANETAPCGEGLVCVRSLLFDWGFCQAWCDLDAAASACQPGSRCRSIDAAGGRRGPVCVADND